MEFAAAEFYNTRTNAVIFALRAIGYQFHADTQCRDTLIMIDREGLAIVMFSTLLNEDALATVKKIRSQGNTKPLLVIYNIANSSQKIALLDAGADVCLHNDTPEEEIPALISSLIRGRGWVSETDHKITVGEIVIDIRRYRVWTNGEPIDLTKSEFLVLLVLAKNADRFVTREEIIDGALLDGNNAKSNIVDKRIVGIRDKLQKAVQANTIITKRGVGYMLKTKSMIFAASPK